VTSRKQLNIGLSALLIAGLAFTAAGASVPHEETIAFGIFLMLAAASALLGLNWPAERAHTVTSLSDYRARKMHIQIGHKR